MRYGFCKEFSTPMKTEVDYALIEDIKEAGFDYVEMRAMLVASLSDGEFARLRDTLRGLDLAADCACALFPRTVRVTGRDAKPDEVAAYTRHTFSRLAALGTRTVVLGSAPARALDEETDEESGYRQLADILTAAVVPYAEAYGITVVIEPLRADACNFIHTLREGARVVREVGSPSVRLLGDTIHMNSNADNPDDVLTYRDILRHFHIAELDRILPEREYSAYTQGVLARLAAIGYDGTVSFETKRGEGLASMRRALALLKNTLEKA